ncbi:9715_t:CDS:2, partial [Racocetra persica]
MSKIRSLKKIVKRLKRDVESLETELEDLDDCVNKDTVVDLIHEIVLSLINEKGKSSSYSSKTSEESDSAETFEKLIDELTTKNLDSTENIITQSSSVPTGENNPESVNFLNLYRQIVKAEDGNKKAIQDIIRAYYNFGHDLKKRLKYHKKNHKKQ